jgi:hypothetical protein
MPFGIIPDSAFGFAGIPIRPDLFSFSLKLPGKVF